MNENQKDKKKLIGILIAVILVTIGVSYAYFVATFQNLGVRTTELSTEVLGSLKLTAEEATYTSGGQYPGDMAIQKFYIEPVGVGKGTYEIDLTGVIDESIFASDVEIQLYKSLDNTAVTITEGELTQNGAQFSRVDTLVTNGLTPVYTGTLKNGVNILLQEDFEVINQSGLKVREKSTDTAVNKYTFYLVYNYKNNGNQNAQMGQTFSGTVSAKIIEELPGETTAGRRLRMLLGVPRPSPNPSPSIDSEVIDKGEVASGETDVVACTKTYAHDDNGNLRFVGTQPCNYIAFNDEEPYIEDYYTVASAEGEAATNEWGYLEGPTMNYSTAYNGWRIIGIIDGYIKIIRNQPIEYYPWDTSASSVNSGYGINQWGESGTYKGADLMKLLNPGYDTNLAEDGSGNTIAGTYVNNSLYWNRESGNCYTYENNNYDNYSCDFTYTGLNSTAKSMIDNHTWYLGSIDDSYTGTKTPSKIYEFERGNGTGKICSSGTYCNDTIARTTTWEGYVGLVYPSDVGYAVGGSIRERCLTQSMDDWDAAESCYGFNWLAKSNIGWTMTPYTTTDNASYATYLDNHGEMYGSSTSYINNIYPVVYLKADVDITGEGTPTNPFRISMN